jgi:EAL domain-containing protein (putative c-di-GMP-specific phosphodiesterase class I)
LVADDEPVVLATMKRQLEKAGHHVIAASDARSALIALGTARFDVIVSDIAMPDLSGIDLVREVRQRDVDVPVILVTGDPKLESAMAAIDLGVFRYLPKPFEPAELVASVERATRIHRLAVAKRQALLLLKNDDELLGDTTTLEERFDAALQSTWLAFQPIVSIKERRTVAFEALLRNDEPTLRNPNAFLTAAERLGRLKELGRRIRRCAFEAATTAPPGADLFVNLHPSDLLDDDLLNRVAPLSHIARRTVLEITERASLEGVADLRNRLSAIRALGYRIAIDDLGAGYAGLSSLTTLQPDVAKLDMSLVRGIDTDERRQRVVETLASLCSELSMSVVTEGIETEGERDCVARLGGDLMQGYYFARPVRDIVPAPAEKFVRSSALGGLIEEF